MSAKCGGYINETKSNDKEFKRPISYCARCFRFVSLGDAHLIVSGDQVEFGKVSCFAKLVEQVHDQRDWTLVLDGYLIEHAIVDAHP